MDDPQRTERFEELLRAHQTQIFSYIFSLLRNLEDTKDIFQRTSLVLWRKFDTYEMGTSFVAWSCSVARFEVLNFIRQQKRQRMQFCDELQLELLAIYDQFGPEETDARREALAGCVAKLPDRQRELVYQCYDGSRTVQQVARQLGRTAHSVYNSLRHIRTVLHNCVLRQLARENLA